MRDWWVDRWRNYYSKVMSGRGKGGGRSRHRESNTHKHRWAGIELSLSPSLSFHHSLKVKQCHSLIPASVESHVLLPLSVFLLICKCGQRKSPLKRAWIVCGTIWVCVCLGGGVGVTMNDRRREREWGSHRGSQRRLHSALRPNAPAAWISAPCESKRGRRTLH